MNRSYLAAIIVILALVIGGALTINRKNKDTNTNTANTTNQTSSNANTSNSPQSSATGAVDIKNMAFTPPQISISKGGTVTWTNNDTVAHTVTDDLKGKGPGSESIAPGATYSFTFNETGSFQYHCTFHTSMRGTIVVK